VIEMGREKTAHVLDRHGSELVVQRSAAGSEGNEFCLLSRRAER